MRLCVGVVLLLFLTAGAATAQSGGHIGLYSDAPGYHDYNLNATLYVENYIYIVHTIATSANSSQFRIAGEWPGTIVNPPSWGQNLWLGDPYTGITVTYVGCKALPYLIGRLGFIPIAQTPQCTVWFWVLPDPAAASGSVEAVDCNYNLLTATAGCLSVNGNINCFLCPEPPVAAETSSWGKVKALYRSD